MLSFWWLFSWTVYIFPSIFWMCSHDFNFIFSIKSCGSVDWVCLAHYRISEHGVDFSHYILQKKISLLWTFLCISDSVSCNAGNLYTAAIISFCAEWRAWFACSIFWGWKWGDPCESGRGRWGDTGRGLWANDISINWCWGRFYVSWLCSMLHRYTELPVCLSV